MASFIATTSLDGSHVYHSKVDEWVSSMVMHYHQTGRRLHSQTQTDINAMAQKAWLEMSGQWAGADGSSGGNGQGQSGFAEDITAMGPSTTEAVGKQEIIQTPDGRPMAVANSRGRVLHRAESGGANDWEMVHVPGGRVLLRSPSKGHQEWLDMVVNGEVDAWPSPAPEGVEHKRRRQAMEEGARVMADEAALTAKAADVAVMAAKAAALNNDTATAAEAAVMAKAMADQMVLAHDQERENALKAREDALAVAMRAGQHLAAMDMQAKYKQMEHDLACMEAQLQATKDPATIKQAETDAIEQALAMKAKAEDEAIKQSAKAKMQEEEEEKALKLEKAKAWDDKMKLAIQKEAADEARNKEQDEAQKAIDKKMAEEHQEKAEAMAKQTAKEEEDAKNAKDTMEGLEKAKASNLLALMSQQARRPAFIAQAPRHLTLTSEGVAILFLFLLTCACAYFMRRPVASEWRRMRQGPRLGSK